MKTCAICGNEFEAVKGHRGEKKFCSLKCYWQSKKVESGYKKPFCVDCGSADIFKHRVHQIPKKICAECYKLRWKKLNYDKNFFKKKAVCEVCGEDSLSPNNTLKKGDDGKWICLDCRQVSVNFCRSCGLVFDRCEDHHYCSDNCRKTFNSWFKKYNRYFFKSFRRKLCVGCGIELNEQTRSHKKSDQECNECNYITKRLRKDKAIYGEEYLNIIGQTRLIDSIEKHFKKTYQGGLSCNGKKLDWLRITTRLEKLFRSEHSKTSLNSILTHSTGL